MGASGSDAGTGLPVLELPQLDPVQLTHLLVVDAPLPAIPTLEEQT